MSYIEQTTNAESVSLAWMRGVPRSNRTCRSSVRTQSKFGKGRYGILVGQKKIAFTTKPNGTVSCALDTWEENSLVGSPFKFTASFMTETDARVYLTAKYPHAVERTIVEKRTNTDEDVASVPRPTPPHDLRDEDAWRKYRLDSRRFRVAHSGDAA